MSIKMLATGDREININISGLKIFCQMPVFILLQAYFMNSFPKYNLDDVDKPTQRQRPGQFHPNEHGSQD
jgi:hypothetical protein